MKGCKQVRTDLLLDVRVGEQKLMLYLIFEHQGSVDRELRLRLLGYVLEILQMLTWI